MQRGQLLDLPLHRDFICSGDPARPRGIALKAADIIIASAKDVWPVPEAIDWLRWDAEPCWESDIQTCGFTYRVEGLPKLQIGLLDLLDGFDDMVGNYLVCSAHDSHDTGPELWDRILKRSPEFPPAFTGRRAQPHVRKGTWMQLPIVDMIRKGHVDVADVDPISDGWPSVEATSHDLIPVTWLVQVGENEMLQMLALICRFGDSVEPDHRIVSDCLVAAMEKAKELGYPDETVMIILRTNSPKEDPVSRERLLGKRRKGASRKVI